MWIDKELYNHKIVLKKGVTCVPKILGEGYYEEFRFIIFEYTQFSVKEYIDMPYFKGKL